MLTTEDFMGRVRRLSELASLICDIGAEDDEYARTVIPLIERMLADDYTETGLFSEIGKLLDKVEGGKLALDCSHEYSPEAHCQLPPGHEGDHSCQVDDIDPETRLVLGKRTIKWPNT